MLGLSCNERRAGWDGWEKRDNREGKSERWSGMHKLCVMAGRQSGACDRGGFWGSRAVAESVVYLKREGGADIRNRET